jgi:3-oxosteroid 1-dehydrogenase
VNEKAPYNERGQVHHTWDQSRGEYPNRLMFMLFDHPVVESTDPARFRWPVPPAPGKTRDFLIKGESWPELVVNIRANLARLAAATGNVQLDAGFEANLAATIERWNDMAARGVDEDFLRGQSPIEVRWASPAREGAPSASMYPFRDSGPYYCIILCGGALDTKGGPVTNADAQVMSIDGRPIPGLYGAGNCVAAPAAQAYWGPGGTVGPALVFGYVAARHALGQRTRSPTSP